MLTDDVVDDRLHKPLLEVERCLHSLEGKTQQSITYGLWQPWCEALHDDVKLSVTQQVLEGLPHLFRLVRSYLVKLLCRNHSGSKL